MFTLGCCFGFSLEMHKKVAAEWQRQVIFLPLSFSLSLHFSRGFGASSRKCLLFYYRTRRDKLTDRTYIHTHIHAHTPRTNYRSIFCHLSLLHLFCFLCGSFVYVAPEDWSNERAPRAQIFQLLSFSNFIRVSLFLTVLYTILMDPLNVASFDLCAVTLANRKCCI